MSGKHRRIRNPSIGPGAEDDVGGEQDKKSHRPTDRPSHEESAGARLKPRGNDKATGPTIGPTIGPAIGPQKTHQFPLGITAGHVERDESVKALKQIPDFLG